MVRSREFLGAGQARAPIAGRGRDDQGTSAVVSTSAARTGSERAGARVQQAIDPVDPPEPGCGGSRARPGDTHEARSCTTRTAGRRRRSLARGASLARVYSDLGFAQLGVNASTESLTVDPGNAAAHRFLADTYRSVRRREVARETMDEVRHAMSLDY